MEECEICGSPTDKLYVIELERAHVMVCESCAKGKNVLEVIDLGKRAGKVETHRVNRASMEEEELVDDYGMRIRKAREAQGLPLSVLGERIDEKESVLHRVEAQKTLPTVALTKKLEKELGIKLTAPVEKGKSVNVPGRKEPITLGDAAFTKEDKKR